jgi:hypothetical protein
MPWPSVADAARVSEVTEPSIAAFSAVWLIQTFEFEVSIQRYDRIAAEGVKA